MEYKLPALNALKAFESAARYSSFTKAAQELNITQGAISKQIKILEDNLKFPLFKRVHQGLVLTKKAEEYYKNIHPAFESIKVATHLIRGKVNHEKILNVNILPSLSTHWLIPQLASFKEKHPDITLNIIGGNNNVDFSKINADIIIRSGNKKFLGLENIKFMDEEMLMIANPNLAKKIKNTEDIARSIIINHSSRPHVLKEWMNSVGLTDEKIKYLSFEHFFIIIEAAKKGLGVGFVPSFLLDDLIKNDELRHILSIKYKTDFSYYILYQKKNRKSEMIEVFCRWIKGKVKA